MPTIRNLVDRVDAGTGCVQIKVALPGRTTVRMRALVGEHPRIARGIAQNELSNLYEGDCVEIAYRHGREGFIADETISIRPDRAIRQLQSVRVPPCSGFVRS